MVGKDKMCLHLPERVLRQYDYYRTIPRSPTTVGALESGDVVVAFQDFMVHVLTQAQRGRQTRERKPWEYEECNTLRPRLRNFKYKVNLLNKNRCYTCSTSMQSCNINISK